jgi:hypothetical protein
MKVCPADPNAVIRYPSDPRRLVPAEGCEMPGGGMDAEHFQRLLLTGELVPVSDTDASAPTGREPTTPLTTR